MTVRQRALLERKGELNNEENFKEELVALPTGIFTNSMCSTKTNGSPIFLFIFRL